MMKKVTQFLTANWHILAIIAVAYYGYTQGWFSGKMNAAATGGTGSSASGSGSADGVENFTVGSGGITSNGTMEEDSSTVLAGDSVTNTSVGQASNTRRFVLPGNYRVN